MQYFLLMPALTTVPAPSLPLQRPFPNLEILLGSALAFAEADWELGAREEIPPRRDSLLAKMFQDSNYSRYGVDYNIITDANGRERYRITDWCGIAVSAWLSRVGLVRSVRRTLYHTANVRDCLSYSRSPVNSDRTRNKVLVGGRLRWLKDYHEEMGSRRIWQDHDRVQEWALEDLDVKPGYIVLISHSGSRIKADHITMVRSWDGTILETIEGNARGLSFEDKRIGDAVVINRRDLRDPDERVKIFGIGCVSAMDFVDLDYRA